MFLALKLLRQPLRLQAPRAVLLISLYQVSGFMLLQTFSLKFGAAGKTAVLVYTMPIWTLLLAWPILGERVRGTQWIAAACTLIGLLLIIEPWAMHGGLLSPALGLCAAICWAIGTILVKRLRGHTPVDLLTLTAWQMALSPTHWWILTATACHRRSTPTRTTTAFWTAQSAA